ncbi:MAG: hypothetical protein ACI4WT_04670 [Oligosphaeraceae bacterium]
MKFSREHGVEIDEAIRQTLTEAAEIAGSRLQLSKQLGIGFSTLNNWYGNNYRKGEYITWEQWKPLREFLGAHGLLDADEPRWLLPSELLSELERLRRERGGTANATATGAGSAAASGAGARATAAPVTQTPPSEAEAIRKLERLASWIIACPDISPEAKLRAMAIIHPD